MSFDIVGRIAKGLKVALATSRPPAQDIFGFDRDPKVQGTKMTIATNLLQRHIQTLLDDNAQWQSSNPFHQSPGLNT